MVVQVIGYSDKNKNFTPIGAGLSDEENGLIYESIFEALKVHSFDPNLVLGDGHPAITSGISSF
jgi:hypothetical protein